jgi:hypothetical protein
VEKQRVVGLALILAGVAIPLFLLLFSSGYDRQAGIFTNILNLNVILRNPHQSAKTEATDSATRETTGYTPGLKRQTVSKATVVFPYRFPLAACVFLVFLGIRKLDQSRGRQESRP